MISRPAESVERMTLKRLRQYLPVTKVDLMRYKRDGWIRRIDVASAIFKCILQDRLKYIQGDYPVAWAHWQRLAQELVLVLGLGHAPRASPFAAASQS